jgi:hypothetical protein
MKRFVSILTAAAAVLVANTDCTPAQVATVTNAVFTVEQAACLLLNSGVVVAGNATTELESVCQISPNLEPYIIAFVTSILAHPDAVAKLKVAGLGVKKE